MKSCTYQPGDEIYTDYIRDRLSSAEKQVFEGHLQDCAECRQRLEDERRFVNGIKVIGRHDMKKEIQRQIAERKQESTPVDWTIAFKVAAVMFFLVLMPGMIYLLNDYYRVPVMEPSYPFQSSRGVMEESADSPSVDDLKDREVSVQDLNEAGTKPAVSADSAPTREKRSLAPKSTKDIAGRSAKADLSVDQSSTELADDPNISRTEQHGFMEKIVIGKENDYGIASTGQAVVIHEETGRADEEKSQSALIDGIRTDEFDRQETSPPMNVSYQLKKELPPLPEERMKAIPMGNLAKDQQVRTMHFVSDKGQLTIHYSQQETAGDLESTDSFKVHILNYDDEQITMEWYLPFGVDADFPEGLHIERTNENSLQVIFKPHHVFIIHLTQSRPIAKRLK